MVLSGKCKDDFFKWYCNTDSEIKTSLLTSLFLSKSDIEKNAFVLEFFDSVGIYIHMKRFCQGLEFKEWYYILSNEKGIYLCDHVSSCRTNTDSRQFVTTEAIKKANELYNTNNIH